MRAEIHVEIMLMKVVLRFSEKFAVWWGRECIIVMAKIKSGSVFA